MLVQKFSSHTSKFLSNFSIFVEMAFIQREKDDSCTLPKQMDFTNISQNYLSAIADKRNRIPRKSLNYQTPYQVFLSYMKNLT